MFMIAYNAILFSRESSSCPLRRHPGVQTGSFSAVMKPGGWLGIHTWDTKLTSYTKGYLQVRYSNFP